MSNFFKQRLNNIGTITLLFLIFLILLVSILNFVVNNHVISRYFFIIEEAEVISHTEQVKRIIDSKAKEVQVIARDYSVWDDTYYKIQEKDYDWFQENVIDWLPSNLEIDLIAVVNKEQNLFVGNGLVNGDIDSLIKYHGLNDNQPLYGLLNYYGEIFIIGSHPILRTDSNGPSEGIMILGKKISSEFLYTMREIYGYRVALDYSGKIISYENDQQIMTDNYNKIVLLEDGVIRLDEINVLGRLALTDINGERIAYLNLLKSRELYSSALGLMSKNTFIVFFISFIIIIIAGFFYRKHTIQPIKDLEDQLNIMEKSNLICRVNIQGPSEITNLADRFNQMSDTIISNHRKENEFHRQMSNIDYMTSLLNHKSYYEGFNKMIAEGCRSIAVLFADIDRFKSVNSYYGHTVGDQVLKICAELFKNEVRERGQTFRYGGEEFTVLLPNCTSEEAFIIAEGIRTSILEDERLQNYAFHFPITISIGIAFYPQEGEDVETITDKADKAMFFSKLSGRNKSSIYSLEMEGFLVHNQEEDLRKELLIEAVFALAAAIDAKDSYRGEHSKKVLEYSLLISEKLDLTDNEKNNLRIGALLHDCGKIGIPDSILYKLEKLSDEEFKIIQGHTLLGTNIIKHISTEPGIIAAIKSHHERWDGQGYPDGISSNSIHLFARIIAIADAYHAMISDRPYRKALSNKKAIGELSKNKGSQFDPFLTDIFLKTIEEKGY